MNNARGWFLISYFVLLIAGMTIYFSIEHGDIVIFLNQNRTAFLDFLLRYWTYLGDGIFVAGLIIFILFIKYRYAIILLIIGIGQGLMSLVLKVFVFGKVPRPGKYFEDKYALDLIDGVTMNHYYSFPSGHTMTAFSIGLFLSTISPRKYFGLIWLVYAILVGVSRIYTLQHFFRDTLAGSFVGILVTLLVFQLFKKKTNANWLDGSLLKRNS